MYPIVAGTVYDKSAVQVADPGTAYTLADIGNSGRFQDGLRIAEQPVTMTRKFTGEYVSRLIKLEAEDVRSSFD